MPCLPTSCYYELEPDDPCRPPPFKIDDLDCQGFNDLDQCLLFSGRVEHPWMETPCTMVRTVPRCRRPATLSFGLGSHTLTALPLEYVAEALQPSPRIHTVREDSVQAADGGQDRPHLRGGVRRGPASISSQLRAALRSSRQIHPPCGAFRLVRASRARLLPTPPRETLVIGSRSGLSGGVSYALKGEP